MHVRLYTVGTCVGEGTIWSYVFLWHPEGEIRCHPLFYCSFYTKEGEILAKPEISRAIWTSQEPCTQRSPLSLWNYKQAVIYARFYTNTGDPSSVLIPTLQVTCHLPSSYQYHSARFIQQKRSLWEGPLRSLHSGSQNNSILFYSSHTFLACCAC